MAGYRGHLAGAVVFAALYLAALAALYAVDGAWTRVPPLELAGGAAGVVALCLMFGLWPDVDTNSKGQTLFYSIFFAADVALIATREFEYAAYLGLFTILPTLSRHRGWTHSFWAMWLVPLPLLAVPWWLAPARPLAGLPFYGAAVVGYLSHLVLDGRVVRLPGRRRSGWGR